MMNTMIFAATVAATIATSAVTCGTVSPYDVSAYIPGVQRVVTDGMTENEVVDSLAVWTAAALEPDPDTDLIVVQDASAYLADGHADGYGYSVVLKGLVELVPFSDGEVDWSFGTDRLSAVMDDSSDAVLVNIGDETRILNVYDYDRTRNSDYVQEVIVWCPPVPMT